MGLTTEHFSAHNADETEAVGACLAKVRPHQAVVFLEGDLGAGKTTWVRGFVRACGHVGIVKSPTYTLVEPYFLTGTTIYHFDLYRLNDPQELEFMGARDLLGAEAICLIEWPSKGAGELPQPDLIVQLQPLGAGRQITLLAQSEVGKSWLRQAVAIRQSVNPAV